MNQNVEQQQPAQPAPSTGAPEPLTMFFAVGILINLALITAFLLWAIRQWKKSGKSDPPDAQE